MPKPPMPHPCVIAVVSVGVLSAAGTSHAIVVDASSATHAPVWVGSVRSGSAVAVGDRHIVTAAHVGATAGSTFTMHGERYTTISAGTLPGDLMVLTVDRDLAGYHAIAEDARAGEAVVLAGAGKTAELGEAWGERALAQGANTIESASRGSIVMDLDAGEAGFTLGDSGGGVFTIADDGELELAGVARAISGGWGESFLGDWSIATDLTARNDLLSLLNVSAAGDSARAVPLPATAPLAGLAAFVAGVRSRRRPSGRGDALAE